MEERLLQRYEAEGPWVQRYREADQRELREAGATGTPEQRLLYQQVGYLDPGWGPVAR